jgi:hypothetical protein
MIQGAAFAQDLGDVKQLQDFVGRPEAMVNAATIESSRLLSNSLPKAKLPWSSTYWPDVEGSVATPYNERHPFINYVSWPLSRRVLTGRDQLHKNAAQLSEAEIGSLSPAEKYDLLLGDENFTFTKQVIQRVDDLWSAKLLATWTGICHGWSPASLVLPRPEHSFSLKAPNGRLIPFYPADVKALAAFLWANSYAQNSVKVGGNRCKDSGNLSRNGRALDPTCYDPNPAFFHLLLVNQIGLNQRGFVMDRSNAEVQNQPVYGYQFKYFKVTDRVPIPDSRLSLQSAKVYRSRPFWDPYEDYRSPRAVSLVGVHARVDYAMETNPGHAETDGVRNDKHASLTVRYDLELDENDNIVGGEWHRFDDPSNQTDMEANAYAQPDLVWLAPSDLKAWSIADLDINTLPWNGTGEVPAEWKKAAIKASMNQTTTTNINNGKQYVVASPQPLAFLVDLLIQMSRK